MEWTKEKPTKPGRYKLRFHGKAHAEFVVDVFVDERGSSVTDVNDPDNSFTFNECNERDLWLGPLEDSQ